MQLASRLIISIFFTTLLVNTQVAIGATKDSLLQQAIAANKAYKSAEAIKLLDSALQQDPSLVDAYIERGKAKRDLEKYSEAIKDYDRALQHKPNLVQAYIDRGKVKRLSKQYQSAMKDFDRAIGLNPKSLSAYVWRGVLYRVYLKQKERGDEDFDRALKIIPESISDYGDLGMIFYLRKNRETGIAYFNKTIESKYKNNYWAYLEKAILYQDLSVSKPDLAILNYTELIRANDKLTYSQKTMIFQWIASNYLSLNKYAESIANSNESLLLNPKNYSSLSIRGQSFYYLKNYPAALTDFDRAIAIEPKSSSLYWWRGNTYYALENYQQAVSEYDLAIELSPSSDYLYEYRGNAKLRLFQSAGALADYQKAIQLARKDGNLKLVKSLNNSIDDIQTQPQRIVIGSLMALFLTGAGFAGLLAISRHNESMYLRQFRGDC
jgi:tetratricopeptide (TPR) repeat protein